MSRYYNRLINELRMQLCYSPERRRLEQLERLERLVREIKPRKTYRYDAIVQKLTNYANAKCPSEKVPGTTLRHDLAMLLEDLSILLDVGACELADDIYSVHQLKDMFDATPADIFNWRLAGLPIRYYVMDDAEKTLGISDSALGEFMGKVISSAVRSAKFSKASEETILKYARKLIEEKPLSLTELAAEIQQKYGLAELAAKYIIREHDRNNPDQALYSETFRPLPFRVKTAIFIANREGTPVRRLMAQYQRTRQDIYRTIRQVKAERIIGEGVEYIYNEEFEATNADEVILKVQPGEKTRRHVGRRETHVPAYLTDLCRVPLLGKDEEPELFRRYNYLKFRLGKLWDTLRPSELTSARLEEMRWLRNEASELRNRILEANLRLVIRMAYKHVGPLANVNELISDGNISLMQAVEKFDYARGFRFSTYASWAILKNFAKTIPEENYRGEKFVTGQGELLEAVPESTEAAREEEYASSVRSAINRVLAKLSDREQQIVKCRFGIGDEDAQTLGEVGKEMRVTRERVRQIEARAIEKMRGFLQEESVELDF